MSRWLKIKKLGEHPLAKNKNLEAIYIDKENAQQLSDETQAFSVFNNGTLLLGFMHFQSMPVWMICINPKSHKNKKYIFESERVFEIYFEVKEAD